METLSPYSGHEFEPGSNNNSWANMFRHVPPGSRVLDVGCSTGNFGAALQRFKSCTVVGVDINPADIEQARNKLSAALTLDITREPVTSLGEFDVIIFADVLEHMPEPRDALRATQQLLKDGGLVIYSIPHMGHLSVRLDLLEGRFPYTELGLLDRTHLHFYDRAEINDVFASTGFAIVKEEPVVHGYPEQWMRRRLALSGLVPQEQFYDMLHHTEAHIYQYVGIAVRASEVGQTPAPVRDTITPPDELLRYASETADENHRLRVENENMHAELAALANWAAEIRRHPVRVLVRAAKRRLFPHE